MTNARTPRNFNVSADDAVEAVVEAKSKPAKAKKEAKAKKVTKIGQAVDLLVAAKAENAEASRQELIGVLMEKMEIADKVRASSLYQAAIKRV